MSKIEITVEPDSKSHIGWFVHLISWTPDHRDIVVHELNLTSGDEGSAKFVLESADLPTGSYGLILHVFESGNKASAAVAGEPQVTDPPGSEWPLVVEVPATRTQKRTAWEFDH